MSPVTRFQSFARGGELHSLGMQLLIVTAVLIAAALILMSMTLSHLKNSREQGKATEDTLLEITTIESRLIDFDSALAGQVLSTDRWYVYRMHADEVELHDAMKKLRRSLQNDPAQLERFGRLAALIRARDGLNTYLRQPDHRDEIARSAAARSARSVADSSRGVLWEILNAERMKRSQNFASMIGEAEKSFWIAVGIVCLTFVFGAFCLMLSMAGKRTDAGRARPSVTR